MLSSVFFLFSLLIFPFHVHAETNDVCVASYDSANEVLTVPCVAVDGDNNTFYSISMQQTPEKQDSIAFELLDIQEYSISPDSACIAEYDMNLSSLDIPCLEGVDGVDSVTLSVDDVGEAISFLVSAESLEQLPSHQTISGTVAGGFTVDSRQTRAGNQQASSISQATLSFHNADGESIAEYEQATDENGHFTLEVPSQEAVYLKVKGGFFANDTTRPFNSELMVLCVPSEMSECHATAYGSLVMRVAEQQTGDSWNERISQAQDLIHATLQIDRDPALNEIENWQQIFDDERFWAEIGESAEDFVDWRDTLANDILDGYLDTEYLQLTFIGSSIRPNFTLSVFGRGEVRSSDNSMVVDTKVDNASSLYRAYLDADTGLELTATPDTEYEILYWTGCDLVSSDKTRCAAQFRGDEQTIGVTFGRTNPEVVSNVFDVTNATYTVSGDVYDLVASASDTELQQVLANIQVDDYIVSARDSGFLRQVTAVQAISATEFQFTTIGASLEDVITHGTIAVNDGVEVDDLASLTTERAKRSVRDKAEDDAALAYLQQLPLGSDEVVMTSTPGLSLKRGKKSDELIVVFGQPETGRLVRATRGKYQTELSDKITFKPFDDHIQLVGEVTLKVGIDYGMDISWNSLNSMKLIVDEEFNSKLTLEGDFSEILGRYDPKVTLFSFKLKPMIIPISIIPIVLTPKVKVEAELGGGVGVQASLGIEEAQYTQAGFIYENGRTEPISAFSKNFTFDPQLPEATFKLEPKLSLEAGLSLYELLNVSVYGSTGVKYNLALQGNASLDCPEKLKAKLDVFYDIGLKAQTDDRFKLFERLKFERAVPIFKKDFKIFDAEKLVGGSDKCIWLSPAKLAVKGKPVKETLDFTTDKNLVLKYEYTVTNIGGRDLDWSVSLRRKDGDVKFIKPDGSVASEIRESGLQSEQNYTFTVTVDTGNLKPNTSDDIGKRLLSFITRGASDIITTLVSPTYWNKLQFENLSEIPIFGNTDATTESLASIKGDTDISIEIELPVDPLAGAPVLNSALALNDNSVLLNWGYTDKRGLLLGQGYTIYVTDLTTAEETTLNYYGMLDRLNPTTIQYAVTGLKADTPYEFAIEAFADNTWSDLSNIIQARTLKLGEVSAEVPIIDPISAFEADTSQFPKTFTVSAKDSKGNVLNDFIIQITQQPKNAKVSVVSGTEIRYSLSEPVSLGADSFEFVVINKGITSKPSTVSVTVLEKEIVITNLPPSVDSLTAPKTVKVNEKFSISYTYSDPDGISDVVQHRFNLSGDNNTYKVNPSDLGSSVETKPIWSFTNTGKQTIEVSVQDSMGNVSTSRVAYITVQDSTIDKQLTALTGTYSGTKTYTSGIEDSHTYDISLDFPEASGKPTYTVKIQETEYESDIKNLTISSDNKIRFSTKPGSNSSCTHIFTGTITGNTIGSDADKGEMTTENDCYGGGEWKVTKNQ